MIDPDTKLVEIDHAGNLDVAAAKDIYKETMTWCRYKGDAGRSLREK
jgi:hypothetical protein